MRTSIKHLSDRILIFGRVSRLTFEVATGLNEPEFYEAYRALSTVLDKVEIELTDDIITLSVPDVAEIDFETYIVVDPRLARHVAEMVVSLHKEGYVKASFSRNGREGILKVFTDDGELYVTVYPDGNYVINTDSEFVLEYKPKSVMLSLIFDKVRRELISNEFEKLGMTEVVIVSDYGNTTPVYVGDTVKKIIVPVK